MKKAINCARLDSWLFVQLSNYHVNIERINVASLWIVLWFNLINVFTVVFFHVGVLTHYEIPFNKFCLIDKHITTFFNALMFLQCTYITRLSLCWHQTYVKYTFTCWLYINIKTIHNVYVGGMHSVSIRLLAFELLSSLANFAHTCWHVSVLIRTVDYNILYKLYKLVNL